MIKNIWWKNNIVMTIGLLCSFVVLHADTIFRSSPRDKNMGYALTTGPVPANALCLDTQTVNGMETLIAYGSAVQPSIAVNPLNDEHIVAAWEQAVINNNGALEIGIARSKNGGHSWKRTVVPFQTCISGFTQRMGNVWLSYASNGDLYLSAQALNATQDTNTLNQTGIVTSLSTDNGKTWSNPHWAVASPAYLNAASTDPVPINTSITADRNNVNNVYAVWDTLDNSTSMHSATYLVRTTDGGTTWLPHQLLYDPSNDAGISTPSAATSLRQTTNNVIVVLPSNGPHGGDLLNFMVRIYPTTNASDAVFAADVWPYQYRVIDIAYVRSTDQGATWSTDATVVATVLNGRVGLDPLVYTGGYELMGGVLAGVGDLMRTGNLTPSYAVNPVNGNLYVVWQTSMLTTNQLPQIALSTSRDGGITWSDAVKVSQTSKKVPNPQAFTPFVAVDKKNHVGVLYSDFRKDTSSNSTETKTNTWLAMFKESPSITGGNTGIGLNFKKEHRFSENSYIAQNGPVTTQGIMTNGNYSFLVASDKRFYAAYTQTMNGPFAAPDILMSSGDTVLALDYNIRTAPFFSRVKGSST